MLNILLGFLIIFGPIIVYNLPFIILTVIGFSRMKKGKKHYYYFFIAAICVAIIINVLFLMTPYSSEYADVATDYSIPLVISSVVAIGIALLMLKVKKTRIFPQQLNVGNKWLDFYTKIRYPLTIVVGFYRIGTDLFNADQQGLFGDPAFWVAFIAELAFFIFFWVALNELSRRTRRGYNLNNLLLCIEGFYVPFVSSFGSYADDLPVTLTAWLIVTLLYYACWVTPNLIYFKHRQYLFFDDSGTKGSDFGYDEEYESNHKIAAELVNKAEQDVIKKSRKPGFKDDFVEKNVTTEGDQAFCMMCGASVDKTARYCRSCGAELKKQSEHNSRRPDTGGAIVNVDKSHVPVSRDELVSSAFSDLNPTLRRAYYCIEDGEWDHAADYLEQVLDSDPENPYANLGVAMIKVGVGSPFNPTDEEIKEMKKLRVYYRAKKYADGRLAELFDDWENK